ncbi:MAG: hypothetical protein NC120_12510 [Ruminococcus sp.]|nr:hypothetical protein [Ruminococcus sp.]
MENYAEFNDLLQQGFITDDMVVTAYRLFLTVEYCERRVMINKSLQCWDLSSEQKELLNKPLEITEEAEKFLDNLCSILRPSYKDEELAIHPIGYLDDIIEEIQRKKKGNDVK